MNQTDLYVSHDGTIKVSGGTDCKKAAKCALHFLRKGIAEVDFFYLGANAGQQAMKAMGIMRMMLETATEEKVTVLFRPYSVKTMVQDPSTFNPVEKDAVYWRCVLVRIEDLEKVIIKNGTQPITLAVTD